MTDRELSDAYWFVLSALAMKNYATASERAAHAADILVAAVKVGE